MAHVLINLLVWAILQETSRYFRATVIQSFTILEQTCIIICIRTLL